MKVLFLLFFAFCICAKNVKEVKSIDGITIKVRTVEEIKRDLKKNYLESAEEWKRNKTNENTLVKNLNWRIYSRVKDKRNEAIVRVYNNTGIRKMYSVAISSKRGDKRESIIVDIEDSARVIVAFRPYKIEIIDNIKKKKAIYIVSEE